MNRKITSQTQAHIKRQAKVIKKELEIPYSQALEKAAINAGFTNWKNFLNTLKSDKKSLNKERTIRIEINSSTVSEQNFIDPYRNLIVAATNALVEGKHILLDVTNSESIGRENGSIFTTLFGFDSVVIWRTISHEEICISVWYKYDQALHNLAISKANENEKYNDTLPFVDRRKYKNFLAITASAWLERKTGKYLQGTARENIFHVYTRKGEIDNLEKLPLVSPLGFATEGKYFH